MRQGIFSCAAGAPLSEVVGMMAKHRVHAVAVTDGPGGRPVGVVSDLDVIAALLAGLQTTALQAATEPLTVSGEASLRRASQLMTEHGVSHLVVVDSASGYPVGVISTTDLVGAYAGRLGD
jgi:CBS domain-containing protein